MAKKAKPKSVSFFTHNRYDQITGCWNWMASKDGKGYGKLRYLGRLEQVHRLSAHFYLRFDLKSTLHVCHHCDNPACFNPAHLFIGTRSDNQRDSVSKGRNYSPSAVKVACPQGHTYSHTDSHGHRHCRICERAARARWEGR